MSLNLYKFTGDRKQVLKDSNHGAALIETINGSWRADTDILKPVITIEPTETSTIAKICKECNYAYLADFGRYYYIEDIVALPGSVLELHLSIDVLMSWATEILALNEGIVARNGEARNSNLYLDDAEIHIYNNPNIQTYKFTPAAGSLTFGQQSFVLAVAGS